MPPPSEPRWPAFRRPRDGEKMDRDEPAFEFCAGSSVSISSPSAARSAAPRFASRRGLLCDLCVLQRHDTAPCEIVAAAVCGPHTKHPLGRLARQVRYATLTPDGYTRRPV